jgi:L-2-hydroxyglutarate oxidase
MSKASVRVAIIGGGIVGLATARQLLLRSPSTRVLLFEKEDRPGKHQTGHNSGVLHCGLYYAPGSAKARLAVKGIRSMIDFCTEKQLPFERCGKIVIATRPSELPRLQQLLQRGTANGLAGLEWLGPEQIREIEPHAAGLAALRVPEEGIVDYAAVAAAMASDITAFGGKISLRSEVQRIQFSHGAWTLNTTNGDFQADFLINCAGLHSDRIRAKAGAADQTRIVPFRGEYYTLRPERQGLVRHLIYPVPDPHFPFLGVHFTRLIHGGVEAGPNAVLAFAREGYRWTDVSIRDLAETLTYKGFWRFLVRYPAACWSELLRSFSKEMFCRSLQRLVPELRLEDLSPGGAGVRAQALSPDGKLVQDFHFVRQRGALHVVNAPSPAATASLAIAEEILNMAEAIPR